MVDFFKDFTTPYTDETIAMVSVKSPLVDKFSKLLGAENVYKDYDDSVIQRVLERQNRQWAKSIVPTHVTIFLDDMQYEKICDSSAFQDLVVLNTRFKVTLIMLMPMLYLSNAQVRANVDYVFASQSTMYPGKLHEHYFQEHIPTLDQLKNALHEYKCLVLNNKTALKKDAVSYFSG